MVTGCTPKAVQHRLVNIKARARKANGGDDNTSSTPGTPASSIGTPRKRSPNKKTTTPKSKRTDNYGNLQSYDELVSTPSAGKGKKRGRLLDNDAANEEDQVDTKRVKTEYKGDFDGLDGDRYGKLGNIFDGPQNARTLEENDEDNLI